MIRPLTVVLALAGLLAACGGSADVTGGPAPPQTPYRFGTIRMGHWGMGPIREASYFEQPVIQALFPRAKVQDVTLRISDDETRDGITVVQDGTELLEIDDGLGNYPGTDDPMIGEVRAVGGPIRGPSGERLGMSWNAARFDLSQCEIGVDRDRNTVICARQGEGAVTFQFAVPGWDSEEMPPESLMRKAAYLKTIIWTPPPLPGQPTLPASDDQ
jgi:hypothetical protein